MRCNVRCWFAQSDSCTCECDGKNHGGMRASDVQAPDTITEKGIVGQNRAVYIDGDKLDPAESLKVKNHSPDGFNWGYGGSGPAQLALALLMHFADKEFALNNYRDFKFEVIAKLPKDEFKIDTNVVTDWIRSRV